MPAFFVDFTFAEIERTTFSMKTADILFVGASMSVEVITRNFVDVGLA